MTFKGFLARAGMIREARRHLLTIDRADRMLALLKDNDPWKESAYWASKGNEALQWMTMVYHWYADRYPGSVGFGEALEELREEDKEC